MEFLKCKHHEEKGMQLILFKLLHKNAVLATSVFIFFPMLLAGLLKLWDIWQRHQLVTTTVTFIISLVIYFSGQVNVVLSHYNPQARWLSTRQ